MVGLGAGLTGVPVMFPDRLGLVLWLGLVARARVGLE